MALSFNTTLRNNMLSQITTAIGSAGKLRIYDGAKPASGGAATNLLAEIALANPAAGSPSGGILTFTVPQSDNSADATGTATWARIVDGTNAWIVDMTVTSTGGGGDLQLVTSSIVATQKVEITAFTITAGNV